MPNVFSKNMVSFLFFTFDIWIHWINISEDCLQATLHNKDEQIEKLKESVEIHKQELGLSKEESERLALELNEVNNTLIKDRVRMASRFNTVDGTYAILLL